MCVGIILHVGIGYWFIHIVRNIVLRITFLKFFHLNILFYINISPLVTTLCPACWQFVWSRYTDDVILFFTRYETPVFSALATEELNLKLVVI